MTDKPHCNNCLFWSGFSGETGNCTRYPPTVVYIPSTAKQLTVWPLTRTWDHCGEHRPGEAKS